MASASFLAFANALNRGAHIRVSILLNALPAGLRRLTEIWCFGIGAAVMWYFVYYCQKFVYWSWKFQDISQGQDRTPLWIPQSVMLIGAVILAIALTDHLLRLIIKGKHGIVRETAGEGTDMENFSIIILFLFVLFTLLGTGVWVGLAPMGVAWVGMELFTTRPVGDVMLTTIWSASSSWTLTALPLFIWMGKSCFRTRLSEDMFTGLSPWMARLPGGLVHTNIVGTVQFLPLCLVPQRRP